MYEVLLHKRALKDYERQDVVRYAVIGCEALVVTGYTANGCGCAARHGIRLSVGGLRVGERNRRTINETSSATDQR